MEQKTFCRILERFSLDPMKAKDALSDKRLTTQEKKILESYLHVRNNKNQEVIDLFKDKPASELTFVEAQKNLLLGIVHNNLTNYFEASHFLKVACEGLSAYPYFSFIAQLNYFIVTYNTKNASGMQYAIDCMNKMELTCAKDICRRLDCQFSFSIYMEDYTECKIHIKNIRSYWGEITESDHITHLMTLFFYHVKTNDFVACKETLLEMKNYRKFNISSYYNYSKLLLEHFVDGSPLYFYENEFTDYLMLKLHLKVIHSLESGNLALAKTSWEELMKLYPRAHAENFHYIGDKCIFSLCLSKHQKLIKGSPLQDRIKEISEKGSQTEALLKILQETSVPMTKDELFMALWKCLPDSKDDNKKLSRVITKIRLKYGHEIKVRKGCYYLVSPLKKVS